MTPPETSPPDTPSTGATPARKPPAKKPPTRKPAAKKPPTKKPPGTQPRTKPAKARPAKASSPETPLPVEVRPTTELPAPGPAVPNVEMPPPEGALPISPPPPPEPPAKKGRFGWGTAVVVALAALGGGVAFGALGPGLWGGQPTPSPSPSEPSPSSSVPFVETTRLTIPEGYTAEKIYERASETLGIPIEDFEAAAADPEAIGLPAEANGSVEGWLGPYTYQIPETATAVDVLAEMVDGQVLHLDRLGIAPEDRLDVLTRASLVEREVSREQDRPKVARVIQNRLDEGWKLQFDSTVHYAVGITGEALTTAEQRAFDSPYNTYLYGGLPPGPICSPGDAAMESVLSPASGTWMFFVTVNLDTGETLFATTLEEHNANVAIFREWVEANGG